MKSRSYVLRAFSLLIITLISIIWICRSGQSTPTTLSRSGASSSCNSLSLPPFKQDVAELNPDDREGLMKMLQTMLEFYQSKLTPLESKSRFNWSVVENSIKMGVNLCMAAFSFVKGVKIAPKFPVEDDLFETLAAIGRRISTRSNELIAANSYTKKSINKPELKVRVERMINDLYCIIGDSPYGFYLQWDKLSDMENPNEPGKRFNMIEDIADIIGQLRVVRIVNDMNTIQGVFNQLRKRNKRATRSQDSASGATSDIRDEEKAGPDPAAQCSSAID